ncbi:hypothetical protein BC941DRAFT_443274 [Chlamydoabsidia padenii]|nr:hypothetical protein BC941DRAFT_443274 [Chlamydoabsidia padenii]
MERVDTIDNTLTITDSQDQQLTLVATLIVGSPSTPKGGISGYLIPVDDACHSFDTSTLTKLQQQSWIAVAKSGKCSSTEKARLAQQQGARAILIIGDNTANSNKSPETSIPAGTLSTKASKTLLDSFKGQAFIFANLKMSNIVVPVLTYNIIAETKMGNKSNVIMMGAHTDSVKAGPGIDDDGSGMTAALEIATHLDQTNVVNAIRFCWWTGEEEGILGSSAYMESLTQQQKQNIALYLNADMIGSPNYVNLVYDGNEEQAPPGFQPAPPGSKAIQEAFEQYFDENKQAHELIGLNVVEKQSDAKPFYDAMIPSGGVSTGFTDIKTHKEQEEYGGQVGVAHDPCYHKSCDTLKNINSAGFLLHTRAYAHLIEMYGQSTDTLHT